MNVGDVVTCYHRLLGEWTAAQITDVKHEWQQVAVLELDWSGPEPHSVVDLGEVLALRRPTGPDIDDAERYFQGYAEWVLPRSYKVIGALPLLTTDQTDIGGAGWRVGEIGMEFAQSFNTLTERDMLIETQERDELLEALEHIAMEASKEFDLPHEEIEQTLLHAANQTRDW